MNLSDGLGKEEIVYKSLYRRCRELLEQPVTDWDELGRRYYKAGIREIPTEGPSRMGTVLTESDFFSEKVKKDGTTVNKSHQTTIRDAASIPRSA